MKKITQEELNKQEVLRASYARAREEAEKLKQENEKMRRIVLPEKVPP